MVITEQSARVIQIKTNHKVGGLLISDVHWDSVKCDRNLLKKHLKRAEEEERFVFINGDFFDLMQGRYDPRKGPPAETRKELLTNRPYLDEVVSQAAEFLTSYKVKYIISYGNHETNIAKRQETDVIDKLVFMINHLGGEAYKGKYTGVILLAMKYKNSGSKINYDIYYHHGFGGGRRSKNTLNIDTDLAAHQGADMYIAGHSHHKWHHIEVIERRIKYEIKRKRIDFLRTGSYKEKSTEGMGWEVEKNFAATPLGGFFVDIEAVRVYGKNKKEHLKVETTIIDAK